MVGGLSVLRTVPLKEHGHVLVGGLISIACLCLETTLLLSPWLWLPLATGVLVQRIVGGAQGQIVLLCLLFLIYPVLSDVFALPFK